MPDTDELERPGFARSINGGRREVAARPPRRMEGGTSSEGDAPAAAATAGATAAADAAPDAIDTGEDLYSR